MCHLNVMKYKLSELMYSTFVVVRLDLGVSLCAEVNPFAVVVDTYLRGEKGLTGLANPRGL